MSRRMTKKAAIFKKEKIRKNKIKRMENQDKKGISRKSVTKTISPKSFTVLKMIAIISVPISYFIYSPLLIVCCLFTLLLFIFSIMTERGVNKTYLKNRHVKILKLDSIIALIIITITILGALNGVNTKIKFSGPRMINFINLQIERFCSCLTGIRNVFRSNRLSFVVSHTSKRIDGAFPINGQALPVKSLPNKFVHNLSTVRSLPLTTIFSTIISSVNSILLILMPLASLLSLGLFHKNYKKYERFINEEIDDTFVELDEEFIEKILMFDLIEVEEK